MLALLANVSLALAQTAPAATVKAVAPTEAREGFSLVPANGQSNARNFTFEMKSGETVSAKAHIKNFSADTVHFYLYGADPTLSNTGSPAYETRDMSIKGPGTWIKFDTPEIDLGPDEERVVAFTVTVPAGTEPGEYRAGITMEKTKPATNAPGITIATRVVNQAKIIVASNGALATTPITLPPVTSPSWQTYYFWISFGLFVLSLGLLLWTIFYGKKEKSHHAARAHGDSGHKKHDAAGHKKHPGAKHGGK